MKTVYRKVGNTTVESREFTRAELAKLDPKQRRFLRQMRDLADELIGDRAFSTHKPKKKGQHK